jgi:hypothetical protein
MLDSRAFAEPGATWKGLLEVAELSLARFVGGDRHGAAAA